MLNRPGITGVLAIMIAVFSGTVAATERPYGEVRAVFMGDLMFDRGVERAIQSQGGGDYTFPFEFIRDEISAADVAFANLESMITSIDTSSWWSWVWCCSFRAEPDAAPALAEVGFDVLSVANNHGMDQGLDGLLEGIELIEEAGMHAVGGGRNVQEARESAILNVNGLDIAFLAYTNRGIWFQDAATVLTGGGMAWAWTGHVREDVRRAANQADIVIVSFHFGQEYHTEPNDTQRNLAKMAIDEGAHLIVGHHPHVLQPLEAYGDGYIAYSLGNGVFDQSREETRTGGFLDVILTHEGVQSAELRIVEANEYHQPVLVD